MQHKHTFTHIEGLDISSYQTITDADLLFSRSPYIYLRAYGSNHSGNGDDTFEERVALASSYGVPSGAYYFGTPRAFPTDAEIITHAETECQQFIDKLYGAYGDNNCGDLIPFLDVEEYTDVETSTARYPMASGMTGAQLIVWIEAFRDYFWSKTTRRLGFYTNRYFITDPTQMALTHEQMLEISDMPLWLAEYDLWYGGNEGNVQPKDLGGWNRYALWQYEVVADADAWGISSGANEVDHNRTDDLSWIMPPPKLSKDYFYIENNNDGTIFVGMSHPNIPDYIGTSVYIDNVWRGWIAKNADGVTLSGFTEGNTHEIYLMTEDNYHDMTTSEIREVTLMPKARAKNGITTTTVESFTIDAGAVYKNLFEADEELLGATSGGNTFVIEQEIRSVELDGARGDLRGARRVTDSRPRLTTNLIEITTETIMLALAGSDATDFVDDGDAPVTHDSITRTRAILDTDYVKNIGIVGETSGGKDIILLIENALSDGGFELGLEDKSEGIVEVQFTGHYDPDDVTREPWRIIYPKSV